MKSYGLLFFLSDEYTDYDVSKLDEVVSGLAHSGDWVLGPPRFIDEVEEAESSNSEDEPIRTVGGFLELHQRSEQLTMHIEQAHYQEIERVVEALTRFGGETGCEIELELGGSFVGDIKDGVPSELITRGLLEEWRKSL